LRRKSGSVVELLDAERLALVIRKERMRADRREIPFCVVALTSDGRRPPPQAVNELVRGFRQRLRLTDEIGLERGRLVVVLTDTPADAGCQVAAELCEIAHQLGWPCHADVQVYPMEARHNHGDGNGCSSSQPAPDSAAPPRSSLKGSSPKPAQPIDSTASFAAIEPTALRCAIPMPLWKRTLDLIGASIGLAILSPLLLTVAAAIRVLDGPRVVFTQIREGQGGRPFRIYKFRTMRLDAENQKLALRHLSERDGPAFKMTNDPRLTPLGRILRRSCIDELPQLLNVLRGEMSLVGPRPLPMDESLECTRWQRRRLDLAPGMTGIWQVAGGQASFDEWMRMDLEYARRLSLWFDLWLLLQTALITVRLRGSV